MEQIYKPLLLFIALAFGFSLLVFSFFLHLHNKSKVRIVINGILGIMLILFFLFQGDFIEFCWENMVSSWYNKLGEDRQAAYTFWEVVSFCINEPDLSAPLILSVAFSPFVYWYIKILKGWLKVREVLKQTDIYNVPGWITGLGSLYALLFIVGILLFFIYAHIVIGFIGSLMAIL